MLTISQSLGFVNDIHRLNVGQVKVDGFQLGMKSKYMASCMLSSPLLAKNILASLFKNFLWKSNTANVRIPKPMGFVRNNRLYETKHF